MRSATEIASRCRGLGTLIVLVAVVGCTGLGVGSSPQPAAPDPGAPSASLSATPSVADTTSAAPTPSEVAPAPGEASPTPTASAEPTSSARPTPTPTATATQDVLRPAKPPVIEGTAQYGSILGFAEPVWRPGTVALAYQWLRDGSPVAGAAATTYRIAAGDVGHRLSVRITGTRQGFATATQQTAAVGPVAPGVLAPTPVPVYSGIAQVGQTLTALPKQWGPGEVSFAYQWYRSGNGADVKIDGATKAKYTQVAADEGHRLKVRVSGSRPGFETVQRYSAWTSEVQPGVLTAGTPKLDGAAVSGKTLAAKPGTWKPDGVAFTYHWYRSGLLITKATGATYTLSGADVGYTITVRVTGKLAGYRDLTVESAPTAKVVSRER